MAYTSDDIEALIKRGQYAEFSALKGEVVVGFEQVDEEYILIETLDDWLYILYHQQDCCESVTVEDIVGDPKDFFGQEILLAEERTEEGEGESSTWTFYTMRCVKGSLDIRWYGISNGYYSESVSCVKVKLCA